MASNPSGDDNKAGNPFVDLDGDVHLNGTVVYHEAAQHVFSGDTTTIKTIQLSATVAVAVPSITDPDIAKVDVDVSAMDLGVAVGDAVIAIPQEALPTNARLQGAWVNATDQVQVTFGSEGGNVTGANKNFKFLVIDLT